MEVGFFMNNNVNQTAYDNVRTIQIYSIRTLCRHGNSIEVSESP